MAYNSKNYLKKVHKVQMIVEQHYEEGITTYKGIYEKYVYPMYPMSYPTFLKMINIPINRKEAAL